MKLDILRKVIREEVKKAIKEELQDMLTEAVKIASTPSKPSVNDSNQYKSVTQKDIKRQWSTGPLNPGTVPLEEMLNQTATSMTSEDYRNVVNATSDMVQAPGMANTVASNLGMGGGPAPGLDISQLDFVKKAKNVLDAANAKDVSRRPVTV